MPTTRQVNLPLWLDSIDGVLSAFATRILLSLAIIVSVLIVDMPPMGQYVFLAVFTVEAVLRGILLGWHVLHGHSRATQVIHFSIVLLATVSFIPMEGPGSTILLVGRFARLALLLTYWGPLARDFALIALERERLSQIVLVTGLTAALTGLGAAFLRLVALAGGDVYTSQDIHTDTGFFELLWWSFRQVLDPGNLVTSTSHLWVLLTSLLLTIGGLLLIAVLIGIGASLVEDLVRAERYRRVGLRQHTVVLNASEQSQLVLTNMTRYFTQVRWRSTR